MAIRLVQLDIQGRGRCVASLENVRQARCLAAARTIHELATAAIEDGVSLRDAVLARHTDRVVDLEGASGETRLLAPIDHPDPVHLHLSGTGLTHFGSAASRDKMHASAQQHDKQTDSMRMFELGVHGGKPSQGAVGVQPEWFYKGNGNSVVEPGARLMSPSFALDGGEEPEIAGIYLIDQNGAPRRLGFCLANEFSDHIMERQNYLWLAHSKLRQAALGAELLTGSLPNLVNGTSRIIRDGQIIWEKPFCTGEGNMSHSITNLEHHHFKYPLFRCPGDIHVHFFGCATLSFADGFNAIEGDIFDVRADAFLLALRNPLGSSNPAAFEVQPL
jgi:hypothetical protein